MLEGDLHGMKRIAADVMSIKTLRGMLLLRARARVSYPTLALQFYSCVVSGREKAMYSYTLQQWQAMVRRNLRAQREGAAVSGLGIGLKLYWLRIGLF